MRREWVGVVLTAWLIGCSSPEPEPPLAPPPEPTVSEPPPAPEAPAPEAPAPEPPAPEPEPEPDPAPPAPPPPAEPPQVAAPPEPSDPPAAASGLEARVRDLDDLRRDLIGVEDVPLLSEPLEGAPVSLSERAEPEVVFVRLRLAWLGGELDAAGDEEVRVEVSQGERSGVLLARSLDLESELRGFPFERSPWVELAPAGEAFELELLVLEEDETEDEPMTQTEAAARFQTAALGEGETIREVPLAAIVGVEVQLLGPNREIRLEGARAELGLVRTHRRESADAAARKLVTEAFGPLTSATPPDSPQAALALSAAATRAGDGAMAAAARSTDTWVRRAVPPLAAEARRLAVVAASVAQADPALLRGRQVDLGRVVRGLPPAEARREGAEAPLRTARELADPPIQGLDPADLERRAELAATAAEQLDEVWTAAEDAAELVGVSQTLRVMEGDLRRALRGHELRTVLPAARDELLAAIRSCR